MKKPSDQTLILVASGPLLSTISLGMTSGYSAILLPQLQSANSSIPINQNEASWIASMAALPMAFGCLLGGLIMEKLGRRSTQIITTIPCLMGWITIAFSSDIVTILIGRFLTGLCGGLLGPSTGVYIGETSEPRYRGFLLAAISLAMALGLFFSHLLGTLLHWKTTAIISCIFPILSMILLALVPESPSWLAKKGKTVEAQNAFYWCRGYSDEAKKEASIIIARQNHNKEEMTIKQRLQDLAKREFLKPLGIIVVFIVTNQWAGVNALTFYTVSIMKKTLGHGLDEYLAMLIVDIIRVVMSVITCGIMKKIGRRPLALISGIGTSASLFVLSVYTYLTKINPDGYMYYTIIPMTSLVAYISFITVGFVPLPWAMMGEVFPLTNRNVGSSISSFMAFIAFFSVVKTSPAMFDGLGPDGTFLVYGLVAFSGTIFNLAFLPETKDRTLHEIEDQFKKNEKIRANC
ncbi:facilitated trehalose transporter Tret1 [Asbolus verrucosus]|uniref:Facilitated trehalose transporter Tret1 n=1 Tax=Asbolus verrucosus TaxID=1661398 RepID=A0A482VMW6_ASBVE|nr:facilitated trehalose transporter Tret1 [Asbolus verrucosus]